MPVTLKAINAELVKRGFDAKLVKLLALIAPKPDSPEPEFIGRSGQAVFVTDDVRPVLAHEAN